MPKKSKTTKKKPKMNTSMTIATNVSIMPPIISIRVCIKFTTDTDIVYYLVPLHII